MPPLDVPSALVLAGRHSEAATFVEQALAAAPAGNAGWLLPIEPLLHVSAHPGIWAPVSGAVAQPGAA